MVVYFSRLKKNMTLIQVGICGEHGGEPSSVAFFAEAGLDYVSCSPFRLACLGTSKFSI